MNTMKQAHEIRKQAAKKWNCKPSEILFSECLKMAHKGESMKVSSEWLESNGNRDHYAIQAELVARYESEGINVKEDGDILLLSEIVRRRFKYLGRVDASTFSVSARSRKALIERIAEDFDSEIIKEELQNFNN